MAIRTSGRTTPGIPGPGPGILSGTMSTPDSSSNAQIIDPTGSSVNGIENRGNAGIAVHSTGHLGQSSLRMNNGDFNRPEILPMGTGFHNSSPKKNSFQSRLAHFQQLALNNSNALPPSTKEIQTNNAPPSTKLRNFNIPVSTREIDPVNSAPAPSLPEKIKLPNINTQFNTRETHSIDTTLKTAERLKNGDPQPGPRESLSLNPASIVMGLRKPPGNDFQSRLAHFRELALNSKNADLIPQVGTGRRYSCNVMTAPPSPIQLEHFAFHKSGAASVSNMPTTTNLLQSEIDSTPPTNIIAQGNFSTIKSNGIAASNNQLRAGITDTLSVPPSKDKDAHNLEASVVPRSTPAGKVVPAPKAISFEKEVPRYPVTLSPAPPDVTEHQLVKTIRIARSPGPIPLKGHRPTIAAVSSPPVEPKPRIRVPGRKEANAPRPSRRNRKAMNEYQQMPAVLMLMHDRSKSFSQAKMDIACAAAAEICETPLTFADFSLCRPEDRKIDITGHVRSSISFLTFFVTV